MDRKMKEAVSALSNVYAKYFIEDFTNAVIDNLGNNIALESSVKDKFISEMALEKFEEFKMNLDQTDSATLFIQECAEFALENEFANPSFREVFNQIKDLPSIYHEDISNFAYNAANLYLNTVDKTLISVIGKDVDVAASTITKGVEARISSVETGGRVKFFNWGILSDGLWLNGALLKGYELASVFRPGAPISDTFIQSSFAAARNYVGSPIRSDVKDAFALLVANTPNEVLVTLDGAGATRWTIESLLFNPGSMSLAIDFWERSVNRPNQLLESVEHLSQLSQVIPAMITTAKKLHAEDHIGEDIVQRLEYVNNSVTLCLVGYEAARETVYSKALVMYVDGQGEDPVVDVFVNLDTVNDYKNAGGDEADLANFGTYLDPRKGMITGKGGWSVDWASNRRQDILTEVAMSENESLQQKRANDRNVIQAVVKDTLTDVTKAYAEASNLEVIPNRFNNHINDIARNMTNAQALESFSLEAEITSLLTNVIGDKFISDVADNFIKLATSENEDYRNSARDLTIVNTAFNQALEVFAVA